MENSLLLGLANICIVTSENKGTLSSYFLLIVTYIHQSSLPYISEDYWLGSVSAAVIRLC